MYRRRLIRKDRKRYSPDKTGSRKFIFFFVFLLFCTLPFAAGAGEKRAYVIGVVPQLPAVAMHVNWTPFVEFLNTATGESFKLKVYDTMNDFEEDYAKGVPDLLFSNPVQAAVAHKSQGYLPLVRSSKKITGILFVKKDSDIQSVRDLRGKEVAFVGAKNV